MFFIPGAPCDGYFISTNCYLYTESYEAFHAPFLADFVYLHTFYGVICRIQPSPRIVRSTMVGIMIILWSAGKRSPCSTSRIFPKHSCFPSIATGVPTTFTNQYFLFLFFLNLFRSILPIQRNTSKALSARAPSSPWETTPIEVRLFPPPTIIGTLFPAVLPRGMTLDGNYVNGNVLNPMLQGIMNQQAAGIDDYAYSYAVAMCLMPTEFCVSPRNVGLERSSMECSSTKWFPSKSPSTCWPAETTRNSSFAVISGKPASIPSPSTCFQKSP